MAFFIRLSSNIFKSPKKVFFGMLEGKQSFGSILARSVSCLGIIWGDIGTSPLYTYSAIYNCEEECELPSLDDIKGTLSCVIWALTVVALIKYIIIVLQMDYHGEGGGFAMALNITRKGKRFVSKRAKAGFIILSCVGGGSLISDSLITPALSVLSSVEGLQQSTYFTASQAETVSKLIVPLTVLILLGLYSMQRFGSTKVGRVFGPIMLIYFGSLAGIGVFNLIDTNNWEVLEALSPHYALMFFVSGRFSGYDAFKKLSSIVLAVTGAEAVYADLGHFGKLPIYLSWSCVVYPCLILAYAGQAAHLVDYPHDVSSAFWLSVPHSYYTPMLIIATLATVVASQAMISGCFSLISQAVTLNLFPKIKVINTDASKSGQIYIPEINVLLGIGTILLVVGFQSSEALAGAYGIAVVTTFCTTSILLGATLYYCKWPKAHWIWPCLAVAPFLTADLLFLSSNLAFKFIKGGYVTAVIAVVITSVMLCWRFGKIAASKARERDSYTMTRMGLPSTFQELGEALRAGTVRRGHGMGIFLSPTPLFHGNRVPLTSSIVTKDINRQDSMATNNAMDRLMSGLSAVVPGAQMRLPTALAVYLKVTGSIQRIVIILHVHFDYDRPRLNINERVVIEEVMSDTHLGRIYSATVAFGFAEPLSEVDMNKIVRQWIIDQIPRNIAADELFQPAMPGEDEQLYYFLNKEECLPKRGSNIFRRVLVFLYSGLKTISRSAYVFLNLPRDEIVQLGEVVFL